jgi:squalene synthase HpnC
LRDPGSPAVDSPTAEMIASAAGEKASGENFPVALRLLPSRYRRRLEAVYGFARAVDDMGDEAPRDERVRLLDELEADLGRLYRPPGHAQPAGGDGPPRIGVIAALAPAVAECAIPQQLFRDLIMANRQDQVVTRYQTFDELRAYCTLSANPVGRIVLRVFGAVTPEREVLSDRVCTALQLAEHWQDVAEDFRAGRIYLPGEDVARFGVTELDLAAPQASPQFRGLMAFQVERARQLLDEGAPLVGNLRGAARVAVAGYVAGGRAALAAIAGAGYDVLRVTPRPHRGRLVGEVLRAYATGR